jgi:hypothetical protein
MEISIGVVLLFVFMSIMAIALLCYIWKQIKGLLKLGGIMLIALCVIYTVYSIYNYIVIKYGK